MALTLDATVGGSSANAYLTASEADDYHDKRLHKTDWSASTSTTAVKEAAVVWATRLLDDGMNWVGFIVDVSTPQALNWPRDGIFDKEDRVFSTTEIPQPVKDATAELARLLIVADRPADPDTIGFKSMKVGPITIAVDKLDEISVISDAVYDMVRDFGKRVVNPSGSLNNVLLLRV